jgi:hypothetical protein
MTRDMLIRLQPIATSLPQIIAVAGPEDTALLIADIRVLIHRLDFESINSVGVFCTAALQHSLHYFRSA